MGLYDWVKVDLECPHCKEKLEDIEFQTYDFGRTFNKFEIGQKQNIVLEGFCNMLGSCSKCGCSIEGFLHIKDKIITDLTIYKYSVNLEKDIIIKKSTTNIPRR